MKKGERHSPEVIERIRRSTMALPAELRVSRARKGGLRAHELHPDLPDMALAAKLAKRAARRIDQAVEYLRTHAPYFLIESIR